MTHPAILTSMISSMTGWLTPSSLFLVLNLVIGTIALTSKLTHQKQPDHNSHQQLDPNYDSVPQLARTPSLLNRVKSFNFSLYHQSSPHLEEETHFVQPAETVNETTVVQNPPPQLTRTPSLLERVKSFNFSSVYNSQQQQETEVVVVVESDQNLEVDQDHQKPKRSKSETTKPKVKESLKKSASERTVNVEIEEETEIVERRRPESARLERTLTIEDGDHAVDAKADDFINRFKRQLKLQRLDSFMRYREMLKGGK